MLYDKVSTDLKFTDREAAVLKFWKSSRIFEKSVEQSAGKPAFTFYDGPPTANGKPHIGHVLTRSIKDLIPRYRTMKGCDVLRKAGWDTHGLPVELEVEKSLGLDGKGQIEGYGVQPFIEKCKESVWKYKSEWERMSDIVGYWADMDDPYITYSDNYIESVWWSLKTIADKGLLYKGYKVVPYCPRCGTALSSHEVAQGYKDVKETSVFVKFPLATRENTFFLAWTTTPWTLPSNVALCVGADYEYAEVIHNGEHLIMARELLDAVLGEGEWELVNTIAGRELEYTEYVPLYNFGVDKKAWFITCDPYVTLTDGTGIVHTAPAFGEDDARVGQAYGLPFVQMVGTDGKFIAGTPWEGTFCKDADRAIIIELKERGLLYKDVKFEHSYPYCWRCDTPLLYYARSTWFIKMTAVRDRLVANNRSINWIPDNIKEGRMGNFVENVIDWGLSRERYWGTPLPVWECECGHTHVIGSKKELCEMAVEDIDESIELHKPYIDAVHLKCPVCGKPMTRVREVIDCWYDSGSMPFAQWHYPFENKEEFEKRFPADFISEAIDQTRGWFYTLLAISTLLFDCAPFKNCIVMGHVQDADGKKMSKHLGNVVDPFDVLLGQGADATRWFFYANSAPWIPNRFSKDAVAESQRKFMGTLWNTYAFYVLYANIDSFDPTKYKLADCRLTVMDKWVLSRLNSLTASVDEHLENYRITEAARELISFTDELSNWYVRRGRERYWGPDMTDDKQAAYMTLYTVLETMARLAAPFTPFMAESIYQNIVRKVDKNAPESVHFCPFPVCDPSYIDAELETDMRDVLTIVTLGRAARNTANIKNRQPVASIYVGGIAALPQMYVELIEDELNVKSVIFGADLAQYITYSIKPQMRTLGPRYGKLLNPIREHLQKADGMAVYNAVQSGGSYSFELSGERIELAADDLLIEPVQREGYTVETEGAFSVILDTALTPALIEEGFVREMISKIQTMRKEAGFEVTDTIDIAVTGSEKLTAIAEKNAAVICGDTLARGLTQGALADGYVKEWDINGETAALSVRR